MKDLRKEVEIINGMLSILEQETQIEIDFNVPIEKQYKELHDQYLHLYFKKMPEKKEFFDNTGILSDVGFDYIKKLEIKLDKK